jgi:Na+-transporting methylmalonyl-CoA/oxaloacetate decarboxylase gamma subunit
MPDAESLRQVAESRASLSTWVGIVLLFALFGVIVLAIIGPAPRGSSYEETRAKKRVETLKTTRDEAAKALTTYSWIDKNKGVAHIPIDRAMELTVAELAQKKPAPAGPITTPEPQAAAAPANAAAPPAAPSASPQPSSTPKPGPVAGPTSEIRRQPAAAINPPGASPGTQPGASAPPTTSPPPAAAQPNPGGSQPANPTASPAGSPSPVPEKKP